MFLPLKDINPTSRTPMVTIALIAINVAVFVYELSLGIEHTSGVAWFAHIGGFAAGFIGLRDFGARELRRLRATRQWGGQT
jgi:membrane associated rhomboid family serine protease